MIALVRDRQPELRRLCTQYNVRRLALFGSAARGDDFLPESSDLDFLVEFAPLQSGQHADCYFGLLADLERLFSRTVDLLDVGAIRNPYLEQAVAKSQELLYAAA
jgi:predicted nucleotidyltransferase